MLNRLWRYIAKKTWPYVSNEILMFNSGSVIDELKYRVLTIDVLSGNGGTFTYDELKKLKQLAGQQTDQVSTGALRVVRVIMPEKEVTPPAKPAPTFRIDVVPAGMPSQGEGGRVMYGLGQTKVNE